MTYTFHVFALMLVLAVSAGCQNQLTLRVERVMGVSSTRLDPDSRLARRLDDAIADLRDVVSRSANVNAAMDALVTAQPEQDRPAATDTIKSYRDGVAEMSKKAKELKATCRGYFEAPDVMDVAADARGTIQAVKRFLDAVGDRYEGYYLSISERAALENLFASVKGELVIEAWRTAAVESSRSAESLSTGFGGFVATDLYVVNPSDPMYCEVLDCEAKLGCQPFTKVTIGVSGDSSIMAVMEHAGQIRTYQVSNDPTQLARNIAFLVSKGASAVARFAGAGVLP